MKPGTKEMMFEGVNAEEPGFRILLVVSFRPQPQTCHENTVLLDNPGFQSPK